MLKDLGQQGPLFWCHLWVPTKCPQFLWMLSMEVILCADIIYKNDIHETSLVVQWLGLCAPNAGTQVPSLVRELDTTYHNYELTCCNKDVVQPNK